MATSQYYVTKSNDSKGIFSGLHGVANRGISFQPSLVHPRQHRNVRIHIVVDLNNMLVVMKPMQSPDILLESSFPRNWHSQKKSIQPGIVKPFADIAPGRKNNPLVSKGYNGQSVGCALALLLAHATL